MTHGGTARHRSVVEWAGQSTNNPTGDPRGPTYGSEGWGFNPSQAPPADRLTDLDVLVKSIDKEGLLEPILICESPSGPPRYNILEGHRRYLAVKQLGHETIAAKLLFIGLTDLDSRKLPK